MDVYFSTVVRGAPQEHGGELVRLDWRAKRVLGRVPMRPSNPKVEDPNPRGNTRGGRGVLLDGDEVFAASYHSIHVFDRELQPIRQISNPLFSNLHEIAWDGGGIWASSTSIDAAIKIDRQGELLDAWWPREDDLLARRFDLFPLDIDKGSDNRTAFVDVGNTAPSHVHLNATAMLDGRPLMLLNRFGCVVRLNPTEILVEDPHLKGAHNVLVTRDQSILVNNTLERAVHVFDSSGELRRRIDLTTFAPIRRILRRNALAVAGCWLGKNGRPSRLFRPLFGHMAKARPLFVRGLCQATEHTVLVGISPATILEIDWKTGELVDLFAYSDSRHVCVHGLICPR